MRIALSLAALFLVVAQQDSWSEESGQTTLDVSPAAIWTPSTTLTTTPASTPSSLSPAMKVVDAFREGRLTRLVIQSDRPLVIGQELYVGTAEIPVNVGTPLSRSADLYYYSASATSPSPITSGDIAIITPTRKPTLSDRLAGAIDQRNAFEGKFDGVITAVQGRRAMIDRGTLQEVHERDIYRIYGSSGIYKGLLEVRGIGDLQSSGELYNRWEDRHKRALDAAVGDRIVFAGRRMQFGLGLEGGTASSRPPFLSNRENIGGGGLVWNITLPSGLGVELLAGMYQREGQTQQTVALAPAFPGGPEAPSLNAQESRVARFIAPIWVKKSFFYPSFVSPFLAGGIDYFQGSHVYDVTSARDGTSTGREVARKHTVMPTVGLGIEFLPTRLFRPRLDIRHFFGPDLGTRGIHYDTSMTVYSVGILAAW